MSSNRVRQGRSNGLRNMAISAVSTSTNNVRRNGQCNVSAATSTKLGCSSELRVMWRWLRLEHCCRLVCARVAESAPPQIFVMEMLVSCAHGISCAIVNKETSTLSSNTRRRSELRRRVNERQALRGSTMRRDGYVFEVIEMDMSRWEKFPNQFSK
jgi:hypothetical protein